MIHQLVNSTLQLKTVTMNSNSTFTLFTFNIKYNVSIHEIQVLILQNNIKKFN